MNDDLKTAVDYSDKVMPRWELYKKTQIVLLAVWALFLLAIFSGYKDTERSVNFFSQPLLVATIIWGAYFYVKLRCPQCWRFYGKYLFFRKTCYYCGAILKK